MSKNKIKELQAEIDALREEEIIASEQKKIDDFKELLKDRETLVDLIDSIEEPYELEIFRLMNERNDKTSSLRDEHESLSNDINSNCYHPKPFKVSQETIAGGYLNRGSITTIYTCAICRVEMNREEYDTGYS